MPKKSLTTKKSLTIISVLALISILALVVLFGARYYTAHLAEVADTPTADTQETEVRQVPTSSLPPQEPAPARESSDPNEPTFDSNGIPMWLDPNASSENYYYHPVGAAEYALEQYEQYQEQGDKKLLANAINVADWFVETQDTSTGEWHYPFDFSVGATNITLKAGWSSAMAQGEAISLLAKAYTETKDKKYLDAAEFALAPLKVDVKDGGVAQDFMGEGYRWYEEYPTDPPTYTLNGFMATLLGLRDLRDVSADSAATKLYEDGIETLVYALPYFDAETTSYYHVHYLLDNTQEPHIDPTYHLRHIQQLDQLNKTEKDSTLQYYHDLWEKYVDDDPEKYVDDNPDLQYSHDLWEKYVGDNPEKYKDVHL
jgi:D-glucuronyl C5-epimerase C-terminus